MTYYTEYRYFQIPDRDTQIRIAQYLGSNHMCFRSDSYPIYFYIDATNSIRGWQDKCTGSTYMDIYNRAYPIDVLLHPDRYPEFYL